MSIYGAYYRGLCSYTVVYLIFTFISPALFLPSCQATLQQASLVRKRSINVLGAMQFRPMSATAKLTFPRQNLFLHRKTYISTTKLTYFSTAKLTFPLQNLLFHSKTYYIKQLCIRNLFHTYKFRIFPKTARYFFL